AAASQGGRQCAAWTSATRSGMIGSSSGQARTIGRCHVTADSLVSDSRRSPTSWTFADAGTHSPCISAAVMQVARCPRDNGPATFGGVPGLEYQPFPREIRLPLRIFLDRLRSLVPSARNSFGRPTSNRLRSTGHVGRSRVTRADDGEHRPPAGRSMGPGGGRVGRWAWRPGWAYAGGEGGAVRQCTPDLLTDA